MPVPLRVLLVENDAAAARTLAHMLTEDGFDVEIAFDGATAIAGLGRGPRPDILVLDYLLPSVDGLTVAEYARSRYPGVPIFIVTSYAEVVAQAKSNLDPRPVLISKPVVYTDLLNQLRGVRAA
jgi:two-component system, OmpR family, response regulator MprA